MELLTVRETAQLLKVSPITVRRYIADGRLPAVRVGRGVRVERGAIARVVEPLAPETAAGKDRKRGRRSRRTGVLTPDDPLLGIIGMAHSDGPGDVAENKHKYLAEAYLAEFTSDGA